GTDVSPLGAGYEVATFCGRVNGTALGTYGWSLTGTNESLKGPTKPKALPPGMFLICGDRAWEGIPQNAQGGPCYLGQLTLIGVNHLEWENITRSKGRTKRTTHALSNDCNDNLELWSVTANTFLSLIPSLGVAHALRSIEKLACWSVKQANVTTKILEEMSLDMNSLRQAVLQNRAAIDFLLLAHGHGCQDFDGMCCFNLSDNGQSIHSQLQWLKNHTKQIHKTEGWFDNWLQGLFGYIPTWLSGLLQELLRLCMVLLIVGICLCIG
ncbi:ERB1 protein, partial [Glaucidium brasilianum]|nr:ERB1 protein [Glaucidium brasilianum]